MDIKNSEKLEKIKEIGSVILWSIGVIAFIVFIGYPVFYKSDKNEEPQNIKSEKEINDEKVRNDLVQKYNAVVFKDQDFDFSEDIQNMSDRNFLLEGSIDDIYTENEKKYVRLSSLWFQDFLGIFESNNGQSEYIKNNDNSILDEYYAIVKIDNVSKPSLKVVGNIEGDSEDEKTVELNTDGTEVFLFKGKLIDIIKID